MVTSLVAQATSANPQKRYPRMKDRGCLQDNHLVTSLRPQPEYVQPTATLGRGLESLTPQGLHAILEINDDV